MIVMAILAFALGTVAGAFGVLLLAKAVSQNETCVFCNQQRIQPYKENL